MGVHMRAFLMSFGVLALVACQPVPQDPPVDQAVLAALDANCDLHEILDERAFISQPTIDDPRRGRANQTLVAACIAAGGDVNALNEWGRSPLGAAAYWGDIASLQKLIAAGADPNRFGRGSYHPVASAVIGSRRSDTEVLALLLNAGGNPNGSATARNDDPQPLATAIWGNEIDAVRMLIQAGANVAIKDRSNGHSMIERTLLSREDNGEILRLLLNAGLSATAPMSRGRTPLEYLEIRGDPKPGEVRALRAAGA